MKNYFEVEKSEEETPHRIHINCGENARVVLIETNDGFIVDVYRNTDDALLDTMCIWNDNIFDSVRDFTDDLSEDEQPNFGNDEDDIDPAGGHGLYSHI